MSANSAANTIKDVVVIGLGGVGSFTLRALSQQLSSSGGLKSILGLERYVGNNGNKLGSSHGSSRIFRHAYFEHADYVPLLKYSTKEFQRLQDGMEVVNGKKNTISGDGSGKLLEQCGTLLIEEEYNHICQTNGVHEFVIDAAHMAAKRHNIPVQHLNHEQLVKRFPQFNFDGLCRGLYESRLTERKPDEMKSIRMQGLFEPQGGFVRPELAMEAAQMEARKNGAKIETGVEVVGLIERVLEPKENGQQIHPWSSRKLSNISKKKEKVVELTLSWKNEANHNNGDGIGTKTKMTTILARSVIVTAGAWAKNLLPPWEKYLNVTRQIQGWIDIGKIYGCDSSSKSRHKDNNAEKFHPKYMPTWYLATPIPHGYKTRSSCSLHHPPLYGIPSDPYHTNPQQRNWIKVALHGRDETIHNPSNLDRLIVSQKDKEELLDAASQFLNITNGVQEGAAKGDFNSNIDPASHLQLEHATSCMYTNSPDGHFLVGKPAGYSNVHAAAGLSGHGFKMVPALGRVLSNLTLKDLGCTESQHPSDYDAVNLPIAFLDASRFE